MDSIEKMIKQKLTEAVMGQISSKFNLDAGKASGLINMALPMLLGGLGRNAATPEGAQSLEKALSEDHDGSIMDKLQDLLGDQAKEEEGDKILGHIFGDKTANVSQALSGSAGSDNSAASGILKFLAPVVLGQLGLSKAQQGLDASGLASMLGVQGKESEKKLGGLAALLDRDNDGSVVDDLIDLGKKFF